MENRENGFIFESGNFLKQSQCGVELAFPAGGESFDNGIPAFFGSVLCPSCAQFFTKKVKVQVAQWCPTPWDPMDYTVRGILQVSILEWVAFPFSRGSSQPRDRTQVSHVAGRFFTS